MGFAIACMSGSFKGVFVHGVLTALEEAGIRADAYAAASSSVLPAAYAAIGQVRSAGLDAWIERSRAAGDAAVNMSDLVLSGIAHARPTLCQHLFQPSAARFLVGVSAVTTDEAAAQTQGNGARRLGRKLLVEAARRDPSWRNLNLSKVLFDTRSAEHGFELTPHNFDEVAYATTRMLHAWPIPATVAGKPYIDASYTSLCPAVEVAELGYSQVLAIATEPGVISRDMFASEPIPASWAGAAIELLQPDQDLKDLGVDFTSATPEGLQEGFRWGIEKGRAWVRMRSFEPVAP